MSFHTSIIRKSIVSVRKIKALSSPKVYMDVDLLRSPNQGCDQRIIIHHYFVKEKMIKRINESSKSVSEQSPEIYIKSQMDVRHKQMACPPL